MLTILIVYSILLPLETLAESKDNNSNDEDIQATIESEEDDEVPVLETDDQYAEIVALIKVDSEVNILQSGEDFSLILFEDEDEKDNNIEGYVDNTYLNTDEEDNEQDSSSSNEDEDTNNNSEENEEEDTNNNNSEENESNANEGDDENSNSSEENGIESEPESETTTQKESNKISQRASADAINGIALEETPVYKSDSRESKVLKSYSAGSILKYQEYNKNWYQAVVSINGEYKQGYIHHGDVENINSNQDTLYALAITNPTPVYQKASTSASSWKTYKSGSILKLRTFSESWYEATVYVNGNKETGYVYKNDVEDTNTKQETKYGIALNSKPVYEQANTSSEKLKTYSEGSILKYKALSDSWHEVTVSVKGKWKTGYIQAEDMEHIVSNQKSLKGIGVNNSTHVYQKASTNSKKLKTYDRGTILRYKTFSKNWHEAVVYIDGKKTTGYIQKKDVEEEPLQNQKTKHGVALESTPVYTQANTNSKKLKTYSKGSILKYKTLTDNWYQVTVYINGNKKTGYIQAKYMDEISSKQESLRGIGLNQPTHVYKKAATNSSKLKSYDKGTVLIYKTFTKNWYEATVKVDGKWQKGYIKASHVENADKKQSSSEGVVVKKPGAKAFSKASTDSKVLRTYGHSEIVKFKNFTKNWYEATVIINGERINAYFLKSDIGNKNQQLEGYAQKNPTNIYAKPSKSSKVIKNYERESKLKYRVYSKNWHEVRVKINGKYETGYLAADDIHYKIKDLSYNTNYSYSFKSMVDKQVRVNPKSDGAGKINATRGEVEFYANPANFPASSNEHLQFLVLSKPAGLNATQINNNVLKGTGELEGRGKEFIKAGKEHSLNEAYLIAHALHETGNGSSTLAKGIPVDNKGKITRNKDGEIAKTSKTKHTVYNFFGYGANDSDPLNGGAKYAFDRGWFTVEKAIVGGAEEIRENYIHNKDYKQDTLYKMRWNPATPAKHQYATHVAWAAIQTKRIANIYDQVGDYTLELDIPKFKNVPKQVKPTQKLDLRSSPSGAGKKIDSIPMNVPVKIVGADPNAWYKVEYKGKSGWIDARNTELVY